MYQTHKMAGFQGMPCRALAGLPAMARCDTISVPAGPAAAGWHRSLLPGPGPALPPVLLVLAVLPPPQERGASQCWLLLHSLVCHHRHPRVQVRGEGTVPLLCCVLSHIPTLQMLCLCSGGVGNNPSFCLMCVCVFKCLWCIAFLSALAELPGGLSNVKRNS